jgi:polyisoprenoid-binding protein YceI
MKKSRIPTANLISYLKVAFLFSCLFIQAASAKPGVKISVELSPTGSFAAESANVVGAAAQKDKAYSASQVTLDLNTLKSGVALRDQHMKNKYFQTSKFPKATLTQGTAKDGKFTGTLNVHGVSRPVSGTYQIQGKEIVGKFKCTLSEFEIPKAKYMGVGVEDSVDVEVVIPIMQK